MFFLLGTLLYNLISIINFDWVNTFTKIFLMSFAFVFFALNIYDMLVAKNENFHKIKLQLPDKLKMFNHDIMKKVININSLFILCITVFILGFIISMGEFLCTGQIYLATIVTVLHSIPNYNVQAFLYFLLYDIAFILPLVIIIFIISKGKELLEVSSVITDKLYIIKFINAIFFLILSFIFVLFF